MDNHIVCIKYVESILFLKRGHFCKKHRAFLEASGFQRPRIAKKPRDISIYFAKISPIIIIIKKRGMRCSKNLIETKISADDS